MNEKPIPRMRTVRQAALETGVSEYFVRQLVKNKEIYYVRSGKRVLINLDLFISFLDGETVNNGGYDNE